MRKLSYHTGTDQCYILVLAVLTATEQYEKLHLKSRHMILNVTHGHQKWCYLWSAIITSLLCTVSQMF